ncbi:hypothetical protein [Treponema sp. J25]|uniref:hypothetical protein n=1 Tax=Treponema sp. J25 TaxID=2094121 RepID=UPI001051257F|nr:hypothetical protein [Treponema sp. J25]
MATNKDPSIFEERSTIGSIDELDEYGVWIKSEPKDIEDMKTLSGTGPNDEGQLEEDVESIKKGGSSLSEHESLDVFEPSIPDIEDLPDLDIDVNEPFPELAEEGSREQNVSEAQKESELPEIEGLSFEVEEIEGFPSSEPPVSREKEVPPSETKEAEQIQRVLEPLPDMDIEENVSFEEVTSDEKQDTTDESLMVAEENTSDFTELSMEDFLGEDSETGIPASPTVEEEPLNIDLEFTDETEGVETVSIDSVSSLASPVVSDTTADLQLETVSDFDDLLSDLQKEESSEKEEPVLPSATPEVPSAAAKGDTEEKHKGIFSEELPKEHEASGLVQRAEEVSSKGEGSDLSTQLLMKIAEEIASIKNELATLKEELSHFKGSSESHHEEKEKEPGPRGFFEEEEDEKIALTGDELDNILNTAEFTEETGSGIPESDLLEETEQSQEVLFEEKENLKEENTETTGIGEEPFSGSSLSEPSAFEKIESEELVTDDEIKNLMEEGVTPLSSPPEDTSYLEEDLVSSEPLFEESLPDIEMGDIVLEEPPLEEPAIESIKLELEEGEKEASVVDEFAAPEELVEEENLQEIKLHDEILDEANSFDLEELGSEIPVSEESFAEVVPENFVVASEEEPSTASSSLSTIEEAQPLPELENLEIEEDILTETEISEPEIEEQESPRETVTSATTSGAPSVTTNLPPDLTEEIKAVLSYMDQLLESLPEEKIEEFARSEYFVTYKKLFEELGLV